MKTKLIFAAVLALALIGGGMFAYSQIKSRDAAIASLQMTLATAQEQVTEANGAIESLSAEKAKLTDEAAKLVKDLETSRADARTLASAYSKSSGAVRAYQGLMWCTGENEKWSFHSVDEALAKMDGVDLWDFRTHYRGETIWNNSGARYVYVTAQDDGEEYGFPLLVFPASDISNRRGSGVWDISGQCWYSLDTTGSAGHSLPGL
jgi:hypothetical protein